MPNVLVLTPAQVSRSDPNLLSPKGIMQVKSLAQSLPISPIFLIAAPTGKTKVTAYQLQNEIPSILKIFWEMRIRPVTKGDDVPVLMSHAKEIIREVGSFSDAILVVHVKVLQYLITDLGLENANISLSPLCGLWLTVHEGNVEWEGKFKLSVVKRG